MIRYYNVYNGADIENIDFKLDELQIGRAVPDSATENRAAQLIVENYPNPPAIKHEGNEAYYNPASDYIKLPKQEQFDTVNDYYRTLFHELTHSTGHNKRLNRGIHLMLEKDDYAKEELVAEFGAVFLSAWAGIMWYNNKKPRRLPQRLEQRNQRSPKRQQIPNARRLTCPASHRLYPCTG